MKEFPKMLYRDQQTFITVDSGKEEDAARQNGYMDYADLPKREQGVKGGSNVGSGIQAAATVDTLAQATDAATQSLNKQLAQIHSEHAEQIAAKDQQITELKAEQKTLKDKLSESKKVHDANQEMLDLLSEDHQKALDAKDQQIAALTAKVAEYEKNSGSADNAQATASGTGASAGQAGSDASAATGSGSKPAVTTKK